MEVLRPFTANRGWLSLCALALALIYVAVNRPSAMVLLAAGITGLALIYAVAKQFGMASLLILTAPIHRFFIDVGFALKPFFMVVAVLFFITIARPVSGFRFTVNRDFKIAVIFLSSILISALANGAEIVSLRQLMAFVLVFTGCYQLYRSIRSFDDITRVLRVYVVTGLLLGVTGLMFYAIYFVRPGLIVEGGFFDGMAETWVMPLLVSVDISANAYAMGLLPFLLVAVGSMMAPDSKRSRLLAAVVFCLLVVNLVLTFSRAGMISLVVAAIVLGLFAKGYKKLKWSIIVLLVMTPVVLFPYLGEIYIGVSALKGEYSSEESDLLSERDQLAFAALRTYSEHPLLGVGQGRISDEHYVGKHAHNTYLELLAENGIFTFAIFLALLGSLAVHIRYMYRKLRSPMQHYQLISVAAGTVALLIAAIPTSAIALPLLWMQFTIIVAMARLARESNGEPGTYAA